MEKRRFGVFSQLWLHPDEEEVKLSVFANPPPPITDPNATQGAHQLDLHLFVTVFFSTDLQCYCYFNINKTQAMGLVTTTSYSG